MRIFLLSLFIYIATFCTSSHSQTYPTNYNIGPKFSGGILTGYNSGFGVQLNGTVSNFSTGFPLAFRFGIGYTTIDPGNPLTARKIFINNAENGIPEESGWYWDFRFDMMIPLQIFSRSYIFAGPRFAKFTGNFKYVGGNEDFDINSSQWGLGGGFEGQFSLGSNLSLVVNAGADYFFTNTLYGHDTSYNPGDENINPREDYTFSDADDAVNQPKLQGRFMVGFNYGF